jgi:hypothetical protein
MPKLRKPTSLRQNETNRNSDAWSEQGNSEGDSLQGIFNRFALSSMTLELGRVRWE